MFCFFCDGKTARHQPEQHATTPETNDSWSCFTFKDLNHKNRNVPQPRKERFAYSKSLGGHLSQMEKSSACQPIRWPWRKSGARESDPLRRMELPGYRWSRIGCLLGAYHVAMLCHVRVLQTLFWGPPNMNSVGFLCLSILPNMGIVVVRTFLPMTKFR